MTCCMLHIVLFALVVTEVTCRIFEELQLVAVNIKRCFVATVELAI